MYSADVYIPAAAPTDPSGLDKSLTSVQLVPFHNSVESTEEDALGEYPAIAKAFVEVPHPAR